MDLSALLNIDEDDHQGSVGEDTGSVITFETEIHPSLDHWDWELKNKDGSTQSGEEDFVMRN
jgi:hypothetical protein